MSASMSPLLPATTTTRRSSSLASRWRRLKKLLLAAVAAVFALVVATVLAFTLIDNATLPGYEAKLSSSTTTVASSPVVQQEEAPSVSPLYRQGADGSHSLLQHCDEKFITQDLDHFRATRDDDTDSDSNGGGGTFEQRYFICARERFNAKNGSIFFYFGAEADVELYVNHTGLIWENAEAFSALVVFAEHRYFGKSIPFDGDEVLSHMQYLSSAQTLADYAVLIEAIKHEQLSVINNEVPLIGFGGSYGGMLAAWFRLKYPHLIDGVIAASAPVLAFLGDEKHPVDWEGFMRIVTHDMSEAAGSAPNCIKNARRAYDTFVAIGESASGRKELARIFRLCDQNMLVTGDDVQQVAYASLEAFGSLAMGNYPYPSSYMTGGASVLPAYPVRAACEFLSPEFGGVQEGDDDYESLLSAFRESAAVLFNSSKQEQCLFPKPTNTSADLPNFFDYIACSELYMPMGSDGVHDVFPAVDVNPIRDDARCFKQWGVRLRPDWGMTEYGGVRALRKASNVVFSNGDFDPWSATGVLKNLTDSVVFVSIRGGAHHVDLFFSHPLDPPAITRARKIEKQHMRKWVDEFYALE